MGVPSFAPRTEDCRLLNGRRALVTGADSGIGQGIAYELAAHGAAVAINHLGDGATATTRMPCGASSRAIDWPKSFWPPLDAQ
jgi:NAD(P)-dependent dehydrogenase (short-subunit alcohol dehydrogenase family)